MTGTRRLRVTHVIDSLAASGGAERRLVEEVEALADRFDQRVVRLYGRHDLQPRLERSGIPVVALGLSGHHAGRTWPLAAWRLRRELRSWRPDVVHTSLVSANLAGQLAAAAVGIPVLSTFNRTADAVAGWKRATMRTIERRAMRLGDVRFRAVSTSSGDTNGELYGVAPARVTVLPRGIARTEPAAPIAGELHGDPLFVSVGRLAPEKAQHLLVEAFAAVRTTLPGAQLVIAGAPDGGESTVRATVHRHGLDGAVHLLGYRDDVPSLVAAADACAFSSLWEGWPNAVVEAMAAGTPVVAFAIEPVVEVTGGHAWLAPPGSVGSLAAAMRAAVTEPDAERIAAAKALAERFTLPVVAAGLGDLLERTARS